MYLESKKMCLDKFQHSAINLHTWKYILDMSYPPYQTKHTIIQSWSYKIFKKCNNRRINDPGKSFHLFQNIQKYPRRIIRHHASGTSTFSSIK